jgi:hypothetical protein
MSNPWWGQLDEVTFLEDLYDLDRPPSENSRLPTVRADIQQHRFNNDDLPDDWIFEDPRLELHTAAAQRLHRGDLLLLQQHASNPPERRLRS